MDYFRSKRSQAHQPIEDEPASKRISTPAGQRLSMVLESSHMRSKPTKPEPKSKIEVTTTSTYCNDPTHQHIGPTVHVHEQRKPGFLSVITGGRLGETPRGSLEESHNGSNLSVSVWSDPHTPRSEKFKQFKAAGGGKSRRWGWKRLALLGAMVIALIVALSVGLAVGLKKKDSKSDSTLSSSSTDSSQTGTSTSTSTTSTTSSSSSSSTSSLPSSFPLGTYTLVTFLDTVSTSCTANNQTWTCTPYTTYYSDPQKALTLVDLSITGSSGSYKISSQSTSDLDMSFLNADLALLDEGKSTERYRFQVSRVKSVNMTGSIGSSKGTFECDYGSTDLTGYLYTKMQRTYPDDTISVGETTSTVWPYAVRVEQAVSGGQNVPTCKKSTGESVSLKAQDAGSLCSCLYKNWTPEGS